LGGIKILIIIMKEGQPRTFDEKLKKWTMRGGIVAGILGIIALMV